jgi:hypothetical protein
MQVSRIRRGTSTACWTARWREMAHPGDPPTKLKGGRMRDLEDLPHRNLARSRPPTPWSRELYRNRTSGTCTRNASPQNRAMEKGVNRIVESTKEGTDHR